MSFDHVETAQFASHLRDLRRVLSEDRASAATAGAVLSSVDRLLDAAYSRLAAPQVCMLLVFCVEKCKCPKPTFFLKNSKFRGICGT